MLTVAAVLVVLHALSQSLPFLAAWTRIPVGFCGAAWVPPGNRRVTGTLGKLFGLLALLPLGVFLVGAYRMWTDGASWPAWLLAGTVLSLCVALPWWQKWPPAPRIGNLLANGVLLVVVTFLIIG